MGLRPLALAATAIALGATAAIASGAIALTMKSSKNAALGATIVVSATGKTLYHTNVEHKNTVKCTGACAESWPPLLIAAGKKPVAGPGVTASKLGTIKRPDGKMQVTYGGYALYLYAGDAKAGQVNGQGTAGLWHAVATERVVIIKTAKSGPRRGRLSSPLGLEAPRRRVQLGHDWWRLRSTTTPVAAPRRPVARPTPAATAACKRSGTLDSMTKGAGGMFRRGLALAATLVSLRLWWAPAAPRRRRPIRRSTSCTR